MRHDAALALVAGLAAALCASSAPAGATLPQQGGSVTVSNPADQLFLDDADSGINPYNGGRPTFVGDVDGDGIGDWAVGDPDATDPASGQTTGAVHVVFGRAASGAALHLTDPALPGYVIYGAADGDGFGSSVAAAGDVNGDGHGDLVVGAPGASSGSGAAYVLYGQAATTAIGAGALGAHGYAITGAGSDAALGTSVAGLGDIDGDGHPDVAIGAPGHGSNAGAVYLVSGLVTPATVDLSGLSVLVSATPYRYVHGTGWSAVLGATGQRVGSQVAGLGDFDGDGHRDLAFSAQVSAADSTGGVVIPRLTGALGTAPLQGSVFIAPPGSGQELGASLAAAGDFNGDGLSDLVVGDPTFSSIASSDTGAAFVVYGRRVPAVLQIAGFDSPTNPDGFAVVGSASGEAIGQSVAGAGDVNGDGIPDVVVGAPFAAPDAVAAHGEAIVLYGAAGAFRGTTVVTDAQVEGAAGGLGFDIDGDTDGQSAGWFVGGGGDVTGDGRADPLVDIPDYDGDASVWAVSAVSGFGTPALAYADATGRVGVPLRVAPAQLLHTGAFTVSAQGLPPGLAVDPATGVISGTPQTAGVSTPTITLTDLASQTATNARLDIAVPASAPGSASTGAPQPSVQAPAPLTLGRLSVTPSRFAVGRAATAVDARARKPAARTPVGTRFAISVSGPATVAFTIASAGPTCHPTKHKRCPRRVHTQLARTTVGGALRVTFSGRVGSHALAAGRYTATATAVGPTGARSSAQRATFTIVAIPTKRTEH